jgi:hypothetical protein
MEKTFSYDSNYIVEEKNYNEITVERLSQHRWIGIENEDLRAYILYINMGCKSGYLLADDNNTAYANDVLTKLALINKVRKDYPRSTFHVFSSSQELFKWMAYIIE